MGIIVDIENFNERMGQIQDREQKENMLLKAMNSYELREKQELEFRLAAAHKYTA